MPFIKTKNFLAVKLESTSGTFGAPAAADFNVRIRDVSFEPEIEAHIMNFASGRHSKSTAVMGKKKCRVKFKCPMALGAAAATPPVFGKLLKACGALETIVAVTSVAYTPSAVKDYGDGITASISFYLTPTSGNSVVVTLKGAMGTYSLNMDNLSDPFMLDFDMLGAFISVADGATIAMTSPDTSVPPSTIGATLTVASTVQKIGKFKLDAGNTVDLDLDPADTTGYFAAYISARNPKLMVDPRIELLATDPHYTRWAAGTESVFSFATPAVGGLKWTISAPKAQLLTMKSADRNGSMTWDQEYELHESAGNDEFQILQSA